MRVLRSRVPHQKSFNREGASLAPLGRTGGEGGVNGVRFPLYAAIAAAVLLLGLAPAPARAQGPGGLYGGTLVVATTAVLDPDPLNLAPGNAVLHSLLYDSLAIPSSATLVPAPWLALDWAVNLSARSVTFHVRPNAKFADGTALAAAAVSASYQRYLNAGLLTGFTVAVVDPTTVAFTFSSGGGDFLGKWVALPIAFATVTGTAKASGLFALGGSVPGVSLTITANPNHWRGRPYLDAIRFEFHAGAGGLDAATCDLIGKRADFVAAPLTPNDLTAQRPCGRLQDPSNTSLNFIFAASDPGFTFLHLGMNTQHVPLNDPAFRVALTSALDRELVKQIEPSTDIADSVVTPANAFWFNASVPQYRVQKGVDQGRVVTILDNVNDLLDRAGYFDRDGDGWRDTPAGAPFTLAFLHLNATTDPRIAKVQGIVTNLNAVGIHLNEVEDSPSGIMARVVADTFDLYLGSYTVEADPSFLFDLFHSSRVTSRNYNNLANATLDAMLVDLRDDIDITARRAHARDVQGWLGVHAAVAPLVHYDTIFVYSTERFEGWVREPDGIDNFWSFANLRIIQEGPLSILVVPFTTSLQSGRTTSVVVTVTDRAALPVKDADIALSGGTFDTPTGLTDANGRFVATFTAPSVSLTQDVTVTAVATKPGYDAATGTSAITIRVVPQRLTVTVERVKAILDPGQSTAVIVTVLDATLNPVAGAGVTLGLDPSGVGGALAATSGTTAANGTFRTVLTASVGTDTTLRITATVTATGYEPASASTSVLAKLRGGAPTPTGTIPGLDTFLMVLVVAGAAFVFARWQTRRRKP